MHTTAPRKRAERKIAQWVETKDSILHYVLLLEALILAHWDVLHTQELVLDLRDGRHRLVLITLAQLWELKWRSVEEKPSRTVLDRKAINRFNKTYGPGTTIHYHSLGCQDCPWIEHNGRECRGCQVCSSLSFKATCTLKTKRFYLWLERKRAKPQSIQSHYKLKRPSQSLNSHLQTQCGSI